MVSGGARLAALQGPSMLFYPTAIGWHPAEKEQFGPAQRDAWRTIQRGHAIANGVYVAAVNRVGLRKLPPRSAGLEFWGSSFICDPFGVVLAEASADREEILLAEIDLARIEDVRRNWPFLRDRRIDAYAGITQPLSGRGSVAQKGTRGLGTKFWGLGRGGPGCRTGAFVPAKHSQSLAPGPEPPDAATACPPSGNRTKPPGSGGRTTSPTGRVKFAPIPWVYGEIVRQIVPGEIVRILVNSKAHEEKARRILKRVGVDLAARGVLPLSHRSRLDARLRPHFREARCDRAPTWPSRASALPVGRSIRTGERIARCRSARRGPCVCACSTPR